MSNQTTTELHRLLMQATDRLEGLYLDGLTAEELKALSLLCTAIQLAASKTETVTRDEGKLRFFQRLWGLSVELAYVLQKVSTVPTYRVETDGDERRFE